MKISKYLDSGRVALNFEAKDKKAALQGLLDLLVEQGVVPRDKAPDVLRALLEREDLTSTGLGYGLALPHTRTDQVSKVEVFFARSLKGLDFESLDGNPVHFIFLVIAAPRSTDEYLKVICLISSLMKNESVRKQLLSAKTKDEILAIFNR